MKYFAVLDENNIVINSYIIKENNTIVNGSAFEGDERPEVNLEYAIEYEIKENKIEYSMDNSITNNSASIGYKYDADLNAFIPPCLNDTYILNTQTFEWEPDLELEYDLHGDGVMYKYVPELNGWKPAPTP
jgi:hypothetical protein